MWKVYSYPILWNTKQYQLTADDSRHNAVGIATGLRGGRSGVPIPVKVKVKCTLVQELRLCTGRTAHRGSRGIALLYRH
jgi:hypothetical protein